MLKFKISLAIIRRNLKQILDCFIPNFKLRYEDSENIKADRVNTVVFSLHQIKRRRFFFGTPGYEAPMWTKAKRAAGEYRWLPE